MKNSILFLIISFVFLMQPSTALADLKNGQMTHYKSKEFEVVEESPNMITQKTETKEEYFEGIWINILIEMPKFVLILLGIWFTVRHFRFVRASAYIERFNGGDNVKNRIEVDKWLDSTDSDEERLTALKQNPELLTRVKAFANIFQELGVAYKYRTVNRKIVWYNFDVLVVTYWQKLKFYFDDRRGNDDQSLYHKYCFSA